jgi:hypothetical protein
MDAASAPVRRAAKKQPRGSKDAGAAVAPESRPMKGAKKRGVAADSSGVAPKRPRLAAVAEEGPVTHPSHQKVSVKTSSCMLLLQASSSSPEPLLQAEC